MNKFVSLDKRSKKAQKEYYSRHRCTWGELNPVTKSVPSGKTYNRKKDKKRIGREFRDEFAADHFLSCFVRTAVQSQRSDSVLTDFIRLAAQSALKFVNGQGLIKVVSLSYPAIILL